ncbi:MAG: 3-mercaptopyruvate sulfurtransferase [Pseudomonadota bacterium]
MADTFPILVSTHWLANELDQPDCVVLDATRHLPDAARDPKEEYEAGHIPGAHFLDLGTFTDSTSDVPAALPNKAQVDARLAEIGISPDSRIILYDDSAVKTAARAWFALRALGFEKVAILDGGIAKWKAEGREIEQGKAAPTSQSTAKGPAPARVRDKADMLANLETNAEQVVDARGAARVFGLGDDPVHGGANGRIPGALNVPFTTLFAEDGTFKPAEQLRALFEAAGVDLTQPVITSCGSGVTASVLLFALELLGKTDTALYDGSWMEWNADPDTPKAMGPA